MTSTTDKTTHTPGPWQVIHAPMNPRFEIRAGDTSIADTRWNGHNEKHGEANARLIAAAPEMLEALEKAYEALKTTTLFGRSSPLTKTVEATIQKASGAKQ